MRHRNPARFAALLLAMITPAIVACASTSTTATNPGTQVPTNASSAPAGTAATGSPTTMTPGTSAARSHGPFATRSTTLTLVDKTRPTPAGAQTAERPERTLPTVVYEPDAAGSFPLIVFSHGLGGSTAKYTKLFSAWATAGFIVAAPLFPLTNDTNPEYNKNWADLAHQPGDVRFVIDELLTRNDNAASPLHDRILPDRIGAGGHSLGGATTYGLVYHDCCRDGRIKAAMVLSGGRFPLAGGDYVMDRPIPLLIMHGETDLAMPYKLSVEAFAAVKGPAWFATLDDFTHAPPYEDTPSRFDALVEKTTTDFWLGTLGGDAAALALVTADATAPGLSRVQTK